MNGILTARPLTGRHVLLWLGGFFGIVIAINVWFVTLSLRTFHGEDRQQPYQQGLEYNQTLALRARQQAEGWQAQLALDNAAAPRHVRLTVKRADGRPVEGLKLSGVLQHPADTFRDVPIVLKAIGPGLYEGEILHAGHGRRTVVLHARGDIPFEAEQRIWLP
jgi:nitrogen fixation protein FixH